MAHLSLNLNLQASRIFPELSEEESFSPLTDRREILSSLSQKNSDSEDSIQSICSHKFENYHQLQMKIEDYRSRFFQSQEKIKEIVLFLSDLKTFFQLFDKQKENNLLIQKLTQQIETNYQYLAEVISWDMKIVEQSKQKIKQSDITKINKLKQQIYIQEQMIANQRQIHDDLISQINELNLKLKICKKEDNETYYKFREQNLREKERNINLQQFKQRKKLQRTKSIYNNQAETNQLYDEVEYFQKQVLIFREILSKEKVKVLLDLLKQLKQDLRFMPPASLYEKPTKQQRKTKSEIKFQAQSFSKINQSIYNHNEIQLCSTLCSTDSNDQEDSLHRRSESKIDNSITKDYHYKKLIEENCKLKKELNIYKSFVVFQLNEEQFNIQKQILRNVLDDTKQNPERESSNRSLLSFLNEQLITLTKLF